MRWTSIFVSAVLALVLTGGAVTFHARFSSPPINVFLLTVESLRADRFTDSVAPRFFAAARDAIAYRSHRSIASWTGPNIVTLLTGISPFEQGVHARGHSIAASNDVVLKRLAREGWDIGSVQAFAKTENFQNLGMPVATGETMEGWLARRERVGTPFFFWHHYLETHLPYDPGDAFLTPNVRFPEQDDPAHERILTVRQRPAVRAGSVAFDNKAAASESTETDPSGESLPGEPSKDDAGLPEISAPADPERPYAPPSPPDSVTRPTGANTADSPADRSSESNSSSE